MRLIKVLIVEDRDVYIEIIKNAISSREIILAKTTPEAIAALNASEFDLITVNNSSMPMTASQKEKTIVYTRQPGLPTAIIKDALRAVVKNYIGVLKLNIKTIQ